VQRWNSLTQVPADLGPSVVTLGNFDGVHVGHRAVLASVVELARARGAAAVAVTFDPHPLAVLHPDRAPELITSVDQRLDLVRDLGLDGVLVMAFDTELARHTPEEFVREVFVDVLHAEVVVVGPDTRFGYRNSGDVTTLRELGERYGFTVEVLADLVPDAADAGARRWSSSWVRELLVAGDVAAAGAVLGRPHALRGTVVHGDHRGRELGYPTANLAPHAEGLVPADGVYAGWLLRPDLPADAPDRALPAAVSIGTNPTFDGTARRVEAYVLDRTDLDLYGERVVLDLQVRLRETLRFDSAQALVEQMARDVARCREVVAGGLVPPQVRVGGPRPTG
jgi:riboflavin kinase/FMN adenylyltransferase